jgi:hypothetical protein
LFGWPAWVVSGVGWVAFGAFLSALAVAWGVSASSRKPARFAPGIRFLVCVPAVGPLLAALYTEQRRKAAQINAVQADQQL